MLEVLLNKYTPYLKEELLKDYGGGNILDLSLALSI